VHKGHQINCKEAETVTEVGRVEDTNELGEIIDSEDKACLREHGALPK
jgi:hypothetical protein